MIPLRNNKILPNLTNRLLSPHQFNNNSQTKKEKQKLSNSQFLIVNSSSFPVQIQLQTVQNVVFNIVITNEVIEVRSQSIVQILPLRCQPKQWVKFDFGQNMRTIEIKSNQKENKLNRIPYYSSEISLKNAKNLKSGSLREVSLKKPLFYLKNGITTLFSDDSESFNMPKNRMENTRKILKTRTNSTGLKTKLLSLTKRSVNKSERNANSKELTSYFHQKTTCEKQRKQRFINKKRSLTSNNSPHPVTCNSNELSRFKKSKILNLPQFQDQIKIFDIKNKRFSKKPKFYEKIPFTFQQIELKRKKFDSQFIRTECKTINIESKNEALKTEQSAIVEDICIKEQSHLSKYQDTFQRGVQRSNRRIGDFSQTGTLCESVFQ